MTTKNGMPKVYLAIISIVVLETIALCKGIDGKCLALAVIGLAGLGGFTLGRIKRSKEK